MSRRLDVLCSLESADRMAQNGRLFAAIVEFGRAVQLEIGLTADELRSIARVHVVTERRLHEAFRNCATVDRERLIEAYAFACGRVDPGIAAD
jgi:hypothetical protein